MEAEETSFDNKFKKLQNYIKETYSVESYSDTFSSLKLDHDKVSLAYGLFVEAKLFSESMSIHPKSNEESNIFREKGNKEFLQKRDLLAIETYSVSAAFAHPHSKELALAFANRSAVTFSLKEYNTCIQDIDRSLAGKYPEHLHYKLYERKGKCLNLLGMKIAAKDNFQLSLEFLYRSNLNEEKVNSISSSLTKQINECTGNDLNHEPIKKCGPCFSANRNNVILSASSLVQIEYSEDLGRHLVATADIEPGDILAIEEPFSSVLLPTSYNNHCFHCKKRCHSLIPCLYCVVAMYCSEACRSISWDENHKIECTLVPLLVALDFTKIELIAVRTLLMATKQYGSVQGLLDVIPQINQVTDHKTKGFDDKNHYNSADYRSVHHLVGNLELRSNADVFRRAATAAFIVHLMDKNTDYFNTLNRYEVTDKILNSNHCENPQLICSEKLFVGGLLFKYLMIVPSNAHEISEMMLRKVDGEVDWESVEIGGALYPVLSLINHSCDPNVVRHSHSGDLNILTAIQVIPAGEQIFDNYGYHHAMHDVATRQSKLWSQYHFNCQCQACKEDWPIYSELPSCNPIYLLPSLKEEVDKSSEIFQDVLRDIKCGMSDKKLPFLFAHLALLHKTIQRPWKEYSGCQEAIKQCLSQQANHYLAY